MSALGGAWLQTGKPVTGLQQAGKAINIGFGEGRQS